MRCSGDGAATGSGDGAAADGGDGALAGSAASESDPPLSCWICRAGVGSVAPVLDPLHRSRICRSPARAPPPLEEGARTCTTPLSEEGDGPRAPARRPALLSRGCRVPASVPPGARARRRATPRGLREGGEEGAPGGEQALGNGRLEQALENARRRRIWREEGGQGEQALGDGRRRRGGSEREHGVGREGGRGMERKSRRDFGNAG